MRISSNSKIFRLLFSFLFLLTIFSGCSTEETQTSNTSTQSHPVIVEQMLQISVERAPDKITVYSPDDVGGNFSTGFQYRGFSNITINIGNQSVFLEEALDSGLLSEIDIFYYAQMDAKNGFCQEEFESSYGVTHYTYHYPEYNIRIVHDTLEAPDKTQFPISLFIIYDSGSKIAACNDFIDPDTGKMMTWEDWGITFNIIDAAVNSLTLQCTQQGGMQIGELEIQGFSITQNGKAVDNSYVMINTHKPILSNDTTIISFDWTDDLSSGSYELDLLIHDIYDEEDVHPLMANYRDSQFYFIPFEIE